MLYPDTNGPLSPETFAHPGAAYRGTPFWAWNCELSEDVLARGIDMLKKMGFGGFHIHVRTGMSTPYLTDSFFRLIRFCVEKAKQEEMLAWLYDEDRWPSGAAGGLVTRDPAFRARHLLFTRKPYDASDRIVTATKGSSAMPVRTGNGRLLARYDVRLDAVGDLASYRMLDENDIPKALFVTRIWKPRRKIPGSTIKPMSTHSTPQRSAVFWTSRTNGISRPSVRISGA
jgi:hypothetical protein